MPGNPKPDARAIRARALAEHILEHVLKRSRYSSQARDEIADAILKFGVIAAPPPARSTADKIAAIKQILDS